LTKGTKRDIIKAQQGRTKPQRKGEKIMRLIHHSIIEKATGKKIFTHWSERECQKKLETMENKENYFIGYKWVSI
jgi:hypothetical protein